MPLHDSYPAVAPCTSKSSPLSRDARFAHLLNKVIRQHYSDPEFNVSRLAVLLYLSVSQLNRRARKVHGASAGTLIHRVRMQQAAYHLTNDTGSIGDIAERTGYSSISSFSRAFKRCFGHAPSEHVL